MLSRTSCLHQAGYSWVRILEDTPFGMLKQQSYEFVVAVCASYKFLQRFFVENGKAKTGITLEEPVTGGYVGFFTQALGTDSNLVFDSVMCGPLSVGN